MSWLEELQTFVPYLVSGVLGAGVSAGAAAANVSRKRRDISDDALHVRANQSQGSFIADLEKRLLASEDAREDSVQRERAIYQLYVDLRAEHKSLLEKLARNHARNVALGDLLKAEDPSMQRIVEAYEASGLAPFHDAPPPPTRG